MRHVTRKSELLSSYDIFKYVLSKKLWYKECAMKSKILTKFIHWN